MITKEQKYLAITGGIKPNKEIAMELRKDLQLFPGLRKQILKRIKCRKCGWCCKVNKAHITTREIARIRKFLKIESKVMSKYIEENPGGLYLHAPCPFLIEKVDGGGECSIYPVRPDVCQIFPINFLMLTIGECYIGKELETISKMYFEELAKKLGVDINDSRLKPDSSVYDSFTKFERHLCERQGIDYDKTDKNCKSSIIDHRSLQLILDIIKDEKYY